MGDGSWLKTEGKRQETEGKEWVQSEGVKQLRKMRCLLSP